MRTLLWDPFAAPFMARALTALVLLSVIAAFVSLFVLLRKLAFAADALTHTIFPGVVAGYIAGGDTGLLWGAVAAAILTATALTLFTRSSRVSDDTALAVILTGMFAIGVVLVSRRSSYTADLTALLFGRILTVTVDQIVATTVVAAVAVAALAATAKEQVLRAFDPDGARAAGYHTAALDLILNLAIAMVVVAAVRAVGVLLVVALLVVPAAAARLLSHSLLGIAAGGAAFTLLASYVGLLVSYHVSVDYGTRLAAGPTIVLTMAAGYLMLATVARLPRWAGRNRS
jgi:manganese/iron transport system permease protein